MCMSLPEETGTRNPTVRYSSQTFQAVRARGSVLPSCGMRAAWLVVLGTVLAPASTAAAPVAPYLRCDPSGHCTAPPREIDYVVVDPPPPLWHAGPAVIYLDRCANGCTVTEGPDDA